MEWAAEYTYGRYLAEDIKDSVLHYDHTLWIAFDEEGIKGAVVTRFADYPRKRCLDMVFTGGLNLPSWKTPMLDLLQKWGYDNHCDCIESNGREGWSRIFKDDGYTKMCTMYELPVGTTGLGGSNG